MKFLLGTRIRINSIYFYMFLITCLFFYSSIVYTFEVVTKAPEEEGFTPTLNVGGRIQIRYDFNKSKGLDALGGQSNSFAIRRAWLDIDGNLFRNVEYLFTLYGENAINSGGKGILGATYIRFTPYTFFNLQIGIMDVPFCREIFSSNRKLLFVDRAEASRQSAVIMDLGLLVEGDIVKDKLKYWFGLMNGAGGTEDGVNGFRLNKKETNTYFDYLVRLQCDPLGKWEDGKVYFQKETRFSVGSSFYFSPQRDPRPDMAFAGTKNFYGVTGDLGFYWKRFYLEGAIIYQNAQPSTVYGSVTPNSGSVESYVAYYATLAFTILPKNLMIAVRFDNYEQNAGLRMDDTIKELSTALTWFIGGRGHQLKFQTEVNFQLDKGKETTNADHKEFRWRNQLTLAFY